MEKIKILFLNADVADYLSISLLVGLKKLAYVEVYDYPKAEIIYTENSNKLKKYIRGGGFSLFFLVKDAEAKRFNLFYDEVPNDKFNFIIIGDIFSNFGFYIQYLPYLKKNKTIILDGSDTPALYPYHGNFWRKPFYWFLPRAHNRFKYYKREWTPDTKFYRYYKLIPKPILKFLPEPKNLKKIAFSIPDEKIVKTLPVKTKLFPKHIVDEEVAAKVEGSFTKYAFENEKDYYIDLQTSKYGITTKRSGWDCLRHYEIAANGTVICFKDLDKKPETCAPHGLIPGVNCISYKNYDDLMSKITNLDDNRYSALQLECLKWVKNNTCKVRAKQILIEVLKK